MLAPSLFIASFALAAAPTTTSPKTTPTCNPHEENTCGPLADCAPTTGTPACPTTGRCTAVAGAPFALALPIPAGDVVYCAKGTRVPDSSHSACWDNTRFAVDLATPAHAAPHLLLAPRAGVVVYARGGCASVDLAFQDVEDRCNDGWGNVVRVAHEDGWFTQLAHLSSILVEPNQRVDVGDIVGVEGNTGAAGAKHIHLSLHRGDGAQGPGPSYPMVIATAAGALDDAAFRCGNWLKSNVPDPATLHVSQTTLRPHPPQFSFRSSAHPRAAGAPGSADTLPGQSGAAHLPADTLPGQSGAAHLPADKIEPDSLDAIAEAAPHLASAGRRAAIAKLRGSALPVHRYYLAWALLEEGESREADVVLAALAAVSTPPWVAPWSRMRRALLHLEAGDPALAQALLREPTPAGVVGDRSWPDFVRRLQDGLRAPAPGP